MAKEFFTETAQERFLAGKSPAMELLTLHRGLAHFNTSRLAVSCPTPQWRDLLADEMAWRLQEGEFLEALREDVALLLPPAELDADGFMAWFEHLAHNGPGQQHRLFKWLAHSATTDDMKWFLRQEAAGEAGFDDLLAYTQVKLPVGPKLELARNYWDEMGHGKPKAMHGAMLATAVEELKLQPSIATTVWPALALSNTMLGLAMSRRYTYQSLGALGVVELTAPTRVKLVSDGMRRLGMNGRIRSYFDLHAVLDVHHSEAWNREVIRPLVVADPACARFIAEGALMRLVCGQRCFDCYADQLMPQARH